MSNNVVYIKQKSLHQFVTEIFTSQGLSSEDSQIAAKVLCYADENGFDTHGVTNLERIYVERIRDGRINKDAELSVISESKGTAVIDANNGLGLVVGDYAMDMAIQKARDVGVGCVVVRQSSHFGSAGYYTSKALNNGMIGIAMTNLGSQTIARPLGGSINMIGTNPIAVSVPSKNNPDFVLDMSTTVVATGKIREAQRRGESIPEGWLVNDEGHPQTDPNAYYEGTGHLQMLGGSLETGGAKGYGLGLLVDILCGVLSGASVGPNPKLFEPGGEVHAQKDQNIGHFFLALNIEAFRPLLEFQKSMDIMLGTLLDCPPVSSTDKVVYPGYLEYMRKKETDLVPINTNVFEDLAALGTRLSLAVPNIESEVLNL